MRFAGTGDYLMKDLKTKNHVFDCDFFIESPSLRQIMIRIQNSKIGVVSNVFHEATETALIYYRGKPYHEYTKCLVVRDEGTQVFVMLSKGE